MGPTDAPSEAPARAPTNSHSNSPTDAPTASPTKVGSCKEHSDCHAGEKCKGHWNLDKMCRKMGKNCKMRGTKDGKRWGCNDGKTCVPEGNLKWGTCGPTE